MNATFCQRLAKVSVLPVACVLVACLWVAAGCSSGPPKPKPVRWDVKVSKATTASIFVDLVGVTPLDKAYWQNLNVNDYWRKNSTIRAGAGKVEASFKDGLTWTLKMNDPIWNTWFGYGATEIMIIADLPGKSSGPADGRRVFLPLDKRVWEASDRTL